MLKLNRKFYLLFVFCTIYLNADTLTFSQAYEMALKNSNTLKSSDFIAKSEMQKVDMEESGLYPQINLSGSYKKSDYVLNSKYGGDTTRQGLLTYNASLRQPLYSPQTYAKIDAQKARSKYYATDFELKKQNLAKDLFKSYLDLLKSKTKIRFLQTQLSYDNSKYKELRKKYDMKLANKMDMLQSEVILNSSKINLQNEKQTYAVYEMKLKQFIGNVDIELPELDCDQSIIIDMINVIRRAKMANKISVKLKEAQINIEISRADVKSAFSGHLPNVTFDASYGKFQTDDPTTDVQYDNIQSIMLNVNIPIYSGGYTSSSVAAAELRQKASSEDFFNAKKEMQLEYNKNLTLFETSSDSIFMYEQATESAEVYVKAIEEGYKHGLKTIADFDDAKVKHYDVKYKYIDNMSQFIDAYIGLLIVTNDIENIGLLDKLIIK